MNDVAVVKIRGHLDRWRPWQRVLEDINIWYQKIKVGSFLICNDAVDTDESIRDKNGDVHIDWCVGCYGKYGVIHACRKFTEQNKLCYFKFDKQILIYKPLYLKN